MMILNLTLPERRRGRGSVSIVQTLMNRVTDRSRGCLNGLRQSE